MGRLLINYLINCRAQLSEGLRRNRAIICCMVVFICLTMDPSVLQSQNDYFAAGAEMDSTAYNTLPLFDWNMGQKGGEYPNKVSLRPFCPSVLSQGTTGACSGYAFGYGAMSIMHNVQLAKKGQSKQERAFSPHFIYNQIKKNLTDCQSPSLAENAISILVNQGICELKDFNTEFDCTPLPDATVLKKAAIFKIKQGMSAFPVGESNERKIAAIKACLQDSIPVVVNMQVYKSFQKINSTGVWRSPYDSDAYLGKHYLTIIGYDEQRGYFELMNSWGNTWADRGFGFMKYEDLAERCLAGYYLLLPDQLPITSIFGERSIATTPSNSKNTNNASAATLSTTTPKLNLQGSFQFNYVRKGLDNVIESETQAVRWNAQQGIYELADGKVAIKKGFQVKAADLPRGKFVYIFSCDPTGKVNLHYPKPALVGNRPSVSFIPYSNIELTIPAARTALSLKEAGDDYLCILYSDEALPIEAYLEKLKQSDYKNKDFSTVLTDIIGEKLIKSNQIKYNTNAMFAAVNMQRGAGVAIPIILKVTAE